MKPHYEPPKENKDCNKNALAANEVNLSVRVGRETVDGNDNGHTKLACVLNVTVVTTKGLSSAETERKQEQNKDREANLDQL